MPKQNVITLSSDNGSGGGGPNKNVVGVGMSVVTIRRGPRLDGYEGLPQTEFELSDLPSMSHHHHPHPHPHPHQLPPPPSCNYPDTGSYVPQERYDDTRVLTHVGSIIPIHSFSTPMVNIHTQTTGSYQF